MFVLRKVQNLLLRTKQSFRSPTTDESIMDPPIITVSEGKLRGSVNKLLDGTPYYSFKGIRYAEPPIGELRFKAPQAIRPWTDIRDAIEHGSVCPQFDMNTFQKVEGNEDCLFLNIYTKALAPSKTPVMVYIHGGGFLSGSGNTYGPEFLLQHDVILVTLNYRLEVLGFLCLDTPEVPGNAGLKDQVLALKWVKKNIAKFGGDPDNITIFGESAGSAAVTYHMLSPMSNGLFNKAISQSGTCLQDWAFGKDSVDRAFRLGKLLGKETNNVTELLQFLRSVPAVDLTKITFHLRTHDEKYRELPMHFVPVVEKKFGNIENFIDENPIDIVVGQKVSKVPLMIGYNSGEGLLTLEDQLKKIDYRNKHSEYFVPRQLVEKLTQEEVKEFGERVKRFYIGDKEFSKETPEAIADMMTDIHFAYNTHRFANLYSATKSPIYMYLFDYVTELNVLKMIFNVTDMKGASHADDLFYIFYSDVNKYIYKEHEYLRDVVFKVTKLWTDFARCGNPTPDPHQTKWLPYTASGKEYFTIKESMSAGRYADRQRMEFWNKLYCEAGAPCMHNSHL